MLLILLIYDSGLCVLFICVMQFGLILVKQELRLRLVLTRFSRWRLLQNQTRTTSFSRWRPLAIRVISWEEGLLFSTKLLSKASLAPRLQGQRRNDVKIINFLRLNLLYANFYTFNSHLIVVLLFLFLSFIPVLSLYKATES